MSLREEPMNARDANGAGNDEAIWPRLPLEQWRATRDTLHMWMQIVGKARLALAPELQTFPTGDLSRPGHDAQPTRTSLGRRSFSSASASATMRSTISPAGGMSWIKPASCPISREALS